MGNDVQLEYYLALERREDGERRGERERESDAVQAPVLSFRLPLPSSWLAVYAVDPVIVVMSEWMVRTEVIKTNKWRENFQHEVLP